MEYEPGEKMHFGFTVVGRAVEYMPYFIYAFSRMGDEGVGRAEARYRLERVVAKNPLIGTQEKIFDGEVVRNRQVPTVWEDAINASRNLEGNHVRLEFLTPTFVKFQGNVSSEAPSFAALVQALLIRIPMLSAVHCGEAWCEGFKALARATSANASSCLLEPSRIQRPPPPSVGSLWNPVPPGTNARSPVGGDLYHTVLKQRAQPSLGQRESVVERNPNNT
jgi:hypothetical protein